MIREYMYIFIGGVWSWIVAGILFMLSYWWVKKEINEEKISSYECGFNPFEHARKPFDVQFYLVAILFIIFDLEISFIFPYILVYKIVGILGFFIIVVFLIVLTIGFIYEWITGALDW